MVFYYTNISSNFSLELYVFCIGLCLCFCIINRQTTQREENQLILFYVNEVARKLQPLVEINIDGRTFVHWCTVIRWYAGATE